MHVLHTNDRAGKSDVACQGLMQMTRLLHQFRKMGCHVRVFEFLDKRKLTLSKLREFCIVLFSNKNLPNPAAEWDYFVAALVQVQQKNKHIGALKNNTVAVDKHSNTGERVLSTSALSYQILLL